jgi:hypothetical protein
MKLRFILLTFSVVLIAVFSNRAVSQIVIESGLDVSPEDLVEFLMGPGISYENVSYIGGLESRGIFTNGGTTNLYLDEGVFLTSGSGENIPGPNVSSSATSISGMPGNSLLNMLSNSTTYDAAVLEFDFIPLNDTVRCWYVFGSEEYSEWVGTSFNDVFGFFVSGPNPAGGNYVNENVALIPGSSNTYVAINNVNNGYAPWSVAPTGPCTHCEFFDDNTFGTTLEYDGKTLVLPVTLLVIPGETYHFVFAVGDVMDGIIDTGVFIQGNSFKSPGPADFFAFDFLAENNPGLEYDVIGSIDGQQVSLEVPEGVDVTSLVASYEEHGADVFVDGIRQENGSTPNDYSEPVVFELDGYEKAYWTVEVDVVTDVRGYVFNEVLIGPNPTEGKIIVDQISGMQITIMNILGHELMASDAVVQRMEVPDLSPGIYFVRIEQDGILETRKVIVQ